MPAPASSRAPLELPRTIGWRQHEAWLDHHWHAGQHVSLIAPTGGGKSYLIRHGLLPAWDDYRALVVDVKGDDPTYAGWGEVVHRFPKREERNQPPPVRAGDERAQRLYRLVVPGWEWSPNLRRDSDGYARARAIVGEAIDLCYRQGQWVVVIDETRALTDTVQQFGMGLRGVLENVWQRGRSREVTMIAGTQAPRFVPSSFYDQPSLVYIGRVLDDRSRERLSEIGGATRIIDATLPALQLRDFLVVERDTGRMAITRVAASAA